MKKKRKGKKKTSIQKSRTNSHTKQHSAGNEQQNLPSKTHHPRSPEACDVRSYKSVEVELHREEMLRFQVGIGLVRLRKVPQIFNYSHLSNYQESKQRTIPWWECTSNTGPSQSMSGAGLRLMAASCSPPASGRTALVGALTHSQRWTLIHDFKLRPWNAAIENPELFLPLSSRSISIP